MPRKLACSSDFQLYKEIINALCMRICNIVSKIGQLVFKVRLIKEVRQYCIMNGITSP